jgi:hypothetical protein
MPDEFAAQRGTQDERLVTGDAGDARAGAALQDGQGRPGALHLAGGGGEQLPRGGRVHPQHVGDLGGGELVPHRQLQRLALLGRGAGGLRPGEPGQFTPAPPLLVLGEGGGPDGGLRGARLVGPAAVCGRAPGGVRDRPLLPDLREPAQTGPPGQRVQPGPAAVGVVRAPAALGEREDVRQGRGRRVVVAQHGHAVGEQAVQVRLVVRRRALRHRPRGRPIARLAVHPVRAGGAGRGLRTDAHHSWTVGARKRHLLAPSAHLLRTGETIPHKGTGTLGSGGIPPMLCTLLTTTTSPPSFPGVQVTSRYAESGAPLS